MPEHPPSSQPARRGHRLGIPITVVLLVAGGIVVTRLQPELERNLKNWITAGILQLGLLLTLIWFLFLSRLRWRTRLITLGVLTLAALGGKQLVRVDGTSDGTGLPRLVWKWTPMRQLALPSGTSSSNSVTSMTDISDVPQFFGSHRTGVVTNARLQPEWNTTPPKERWRQPIGAGWSAFAVAGGRAFTQEQRGEMELVTCYDVVTGHLLWNHANKTRFYQWQGGEGPRATPTVHDGRVFAIGGTGLLNCLSADDGKSFWSKDVLAGKENLTWGVSASPLVFEETVVVVGAAHGGPTLLAFKTADGSPRWEAGTDRASYASPMLVTILGRPLVLSDNGTTLTGHDTKTGEIVFSHAWGSTKFPKAAQPVVIGEDLVFVSAGYGMGCMLLRFESAGDGKLKAIEQWKSLKLKTQFNSVAERNGFLYGLDDGRLACVEIASGQRRWKDGRFGSGQSLLVDDLIIVQGEEGDVVLASANPDEYRELGRIQNALSSKTWNHPVLAGRYLLVRNDREAVCYDLPVR